MSKFYLPSSTTESTTSQSPITSPQSLPRHVGSGPMAPFRQLPTRTNDVSASYFPPSTAALVSDLSTPADYSLNDSDSDPDDLPYPLPLARDPFLAPDFDAATYLSTLRNRHQTLEDLRTELRQRAKALGVELVDLVNAEYEDLMGVGAMLGGGEERIEGVRVGVLGFKRELETLRAAVEGRKGEAGRALEERRRLRGELVLGRRLLEVGERVEELERRLVVLDKGDIEVEEEEEGEEGTDEDAENGDGDGDDDALRRLKTTVGLWVQLKARIELVGQHPFFDAQADRLKAIREALLLDLAAALKAARRDEARAVLLKVLGLYRDIGEAQEGIKALKGR